jgi:hypothetical protein
MKKSITLGTAILIASSMPAVAQNEQIGSWEYRIIQDKMSDKSRYIAIAKGSGGALVFKCDEVGPRSVYVGFYADKYLGEGQYKTRKLKYRIDKNRPEEGEWRYDKSAAHLFQASAAKALADKLKGAEVFLVNALTYEFSKVEAEINVTGAEQALNRLYSDCKS